MKEFEEIFEGIKVEPSKLVGWGSAEGNDMMTLTFSANSLKPYCTEQYLTFGVTKNVLAP